MPLALMCQMSSYLYLLIYLYPEIRISTSILKTTIGATNTDSMFSVLTMIVPADIHYIKGKRPRKRYLRSTRGAFNTALVWRNSGHYKSGFTGDRQTVQQGSEVSLLSEHPSFCAFPAAVLKGCESWLLGDGWGKVLPTQA